MFKDKINVQAIGTLKISDKDTGTVLVDKRNAIHPEIWRMSWLLHLVGNQRVSIVQAMPHISIGWRLVMVEVVQQLHCHTALQEFSLHMMGYQLHPVTQHCIPKHINKRSLQQYTDHEDMGGGVEVPENTSKVNFKVEMSHDQYETMQQLIDPTIQTRDR